MLDRSQPLRVLSNCLKLWQREFYPLKTGLVLSLSLFSSPPLLPLIFAFVIKISFEVKKVRRHCWVHCLSLKTNLLFFFFYDLITSGQVTLFEQGLLPAMRAPAQPKRPEFFYWVYWASLFVCINGMNWFCGITAASCKWCMKWKIPVQCTERTYTVVCDCSGAGLFVLIFPQSETASFW